MDFMTISLGNPLQEAQKGPPHNRVHIEVKCCSRATANCSELTSL
jgi:hypothetical protein